MSLIINLSRFSLKNLSFCIGKDLYKSFLMALLSLLASMAITSAAENDKKNFISGKIVTELFDDYTYDSNKKYNEYNKTYLYSWLKFKTNLSKNLKLISNFRLREENNFSEQIRREETQDSSDSYFDNQSFFIHQLNLQYEYNNLKFVGGKFTSSFGRLWRSKDNIWLFDKARREYKEDEKIGIASYLKIGDSTRNGEYIFGLASFINDSKFLNGSILTKRDGLDQTNATQASNKKGMKSYDLSLDINFDFTDKERLSYNFSYINLAVNDKNINNSDHKIKDQKGYSLSTEYLYPFSSNIVANGFVEYIKYNNYFGKSDTDREFLTTKATIYFFDKYKIMLGRYFDKIRETGVGRYDEEVRELDFGYSFNGYKSYGYKYCDGFELMLGFKQEIEDNRADKVENNIAGFLLRYVKEF